MEHYPKVKEELGFDYNRMLKKYDDAIIEKTIYILRSCLWIFNAKGSNIIYGKQRNIDLYKKLLDELTSNQEEVKEQGKQKLLELNKK